MEAKRAAGCFAAALISFGLASSAAAISLDKADKLEAVPGEFVVRLRADGPSALRFGGAAPGLAGSAKSMRPVFPSGAGRLAAAR